ncbi:unnamed protein product [Closterium sp. NIES-54]
MAGPEERGGRGAGGSGEAQTQGQPRDSAMAPMQPSLGPPRDEPRVFGLDKFNGDNFAEWSFKMENIFDHYDLLEVMEGTEKRPENDPEKSLPVDANARLAVRNHLPSTERAHFSQYKSARALYDAVVARYSSPTTAALSCLMLPYLFPDLAAFATVPDLVAHLRTSDARYRAALPTEDHFLSLCPTELTVDLLEERLAAAEKNILAVGASRGDRRTPFFEGCSHVPLLPLLPLLLLSTSLALRRSALRLPLVGDAALARAREARVVEGAVEEAVEEVEVVVGAVPGVHLDAAKRVLRYLCSTLGMGLVLGGRARVVLTGHCWRRIGSAVGSSAVALVTPVELGQEVRARGTGYMTCS